MPRSPSRTSKKKKYNARFPPARIKKIMQTDEEVGKVAAAVPVIISRALEMFIESLISETSKITIAKNAKTLSTSHIKHTIESNKQFDFLRELVANVPDHQIEDVNNETYGNDIESVSTSKKGRGRPKKIKDGRGYQGEPSKASETSEDEEDDEDDEETETEEESSIAPEPSTKVPARNPDTPNHASEPQAPDALMYNTPSTYPNFPPYFMNPALPSLQRQPFLEPHNQQHPFQNFPGAPSFSYPHYISAPPICMASYPHPMHYPSGLPPPPQPPPPAHSQQQQPINLSFPSRTMATTAGESDDYDT